MNAYIIMHGWGRVGAGIRAASVHDDHRVFCGGGVVATLGEALCGERSQVVIVHHLIVVEERDDALPELGLEKVLLVHRVASGGSKYHCSRYWSLLVSWKGCALEQPSTSKTKFDGFLICTLKKTDRQE